MREDRVIDLRWLDEAKVLEILNVARSTFQGWSKAGLVDPDPGGAYGEPEVLELTLLAALRNHFSVQELAKLWRRLRAKGHVTEFVARARGLENLGRYDVVIDPTYGGITVATDDAALVEAVRHPNVPRSIVVIDLAARILLVRGAFDQWAHLSMRPTRRKVGRPSRRALDAEEPS